MQITGYLEISSSGVTRMEGAMPELRRVDGARDVEEEVASSSALRISIEIRATNTGSLEGAFPVLESIEGGVWADSNDRLDDPGTAFGSLQQATSIVVWRNPALRTLGGLFPALTRIDEELDLLENTPALTDAGTSFASLTNVGRASIDCNGDLNVLDAPSWYDENGELRWCFDRALPAAANGTWGVVVDGVARPPRWCSGSSIHVGDLTIQSQAQLAEVAGIVQIIGFLEISSAGVTDMKGAMPALRRVEQSGGIGIYNTSTVSLEGAFPVLESIEGELRIASNNQLHNPGTAFGSLQQATSIQITGDFLGTLGGLFPALTHIDGELNIFDNSALADAGTSFASLTNVGDVEIFGNGDLGVLDAPNWYDENGELRWCIEQAFDPLDSWQVVVDGVPKPARSC